MQLGGTAFLFNVQMQKQHLSENLNQKDQPFVIIMTLFLIIIWWFLLFIYPFSAAYQGTSSRGQKSGRRSKRKMTFRANIFVNSNNSGNCVRTPKSINDAPDSESEASLPRSAIWPERCHVLFVSFVVVVGQQLSPRPLPQLSHFQVALLSGLALPAAAPH